MPEKDRKYKRAINGGDDKKKKNLYKLTKEGRQDIKTRARSEAGLAAKPKKKFKTRSKLGQAITGKRYKVPTGGSGSKGDQEKTMVKPKKVGYRYRQYKGSGTRLEPKTTQTDKFDTSGSSEKTYKEKIGAQHKKRGKATPDKKSPSDFYKSTPEAQHNKQKNVKPTYKKHSRTDEQTDKDRTLKRRLKNLKEQKGERRGKKAMYKERKKKYKSEYKTTGYLQN